MPGKLFEYLAVRRPILAVVPPDATATTILHQTGAGVAGPADDVDALADLLEERYRAWREDRPFAPDLAEVRRYDRSVLAGLLAEVFDPVAITGS